MLHAKYKVQWLLLERKNLEKSRWRGKKDQLSAYVCLLVRVWVIMTPVLQKCCLEISGNIA
jgi:hypothetical protein